MPLLSSATIYTLPMRSSIRTCCHSRIRHVQAYSSAADVPLGCYVDARQIERFDIQMMGLDPLLVPTIVAR
jgi:hypothetical protein